MTLRAAFFLSGLSLIAVTFSAWAQDLVVISGGTSELQPGQIVKSDAPLNIPAGSTVTLVSESGKTVILKGPHAGPAGIGAKGGGDASLISSLSSLLSASGKETTSLGSMRAAGPTPRPADPWVIDVGQSGDHCLPATGPHTLWRGKARKASIVSLKNLGDKSKSKSNWPAGASTLTLPSDVTLKDGALYLLRFKGSRVMRKFKVHLVPGDLPSTAHKVAWMVDKGCKKQAMRLLASIK